MYFVNTFHKFKCFYNLLTHNELKSLGFIGSKRAVMCHMKAGLSVGNYPFHAEKLQAIIPRMPVVK